MKKKINKLGINLIKRWEGFESKPYLCPAGVPTIGYGATYYPDNNNSVKLTDKPINESYATILLEDMLDRYERGVNRYVTSNINENQFSALVSFAYNCGLGALKSSTLLKRVNANPNDENISYQFSRWNKAGGRVLKGLTKRRIDEDKLYFL
jgi:lysozyme